MPNAARKLMVKPPQRKRLSSQERGYTQSWREASLAYLRQNPLCVGWNDAGEHVDGCDGLATQTDHRIPVRGQSDPLFWAVSNWRGRSRACHARKTRLEQLRR